MNAEQLIDDVIGREGGYSNHPADRGGATRWGITEAVARAHGYGGDMKTFPRDEAVALYKRIYWTRPGIDRIGDLAPFIAAEMFDTGVNMGPGIAVSFLQRALNALNRGASDYPDIVPGVRVDEETVAALSAFLTKRKPHGEGVLMKALEAQIGRAHV